MPFIAGSHSLSRFHHIPSRPTYYHPVVVQSHFVLIDFGLLKYAVISNVE